MVLPTRRKAFQIAYGGGYKIYHLSSQYINKIVGYPKKSRPVPPSEGEQKTRENRTPSEGGKRLLETKTRVQALQRGPSDYAPSEGEQKTLENRTPSEGGKSRLETKTRVQALQSLPGQLRTFGR